MAIFVANSGLFCCEQQRFLLRTKAICDANNSVFCCELNFVANYGDIFVTDMVWIAFCFPQNTKHTDCPKKKEKKHNFQSKDCGDCEL